MTTHTRSTVAVALACALTIGACSSGDDAGEAGSATTAAAPATAAEATTTPETTAPATTPPDDTTTTSPPATTTSTSTTTTAPAPDPAPTIDELDSFTWTEVNESAEWAARAGLRVVELGGRLLLIGGRTPNESTIPGDSQIWGDVWASDDQGVSWTQLIAGGDADTFAPRAYFQALTLGDRVFVIGGQDFGLEENPFCALLEEGLEPPPGLGIDPDAPCPPFLPTSQFFNDVWSSTDGIEWTEMTADAPWDGRAGLSAAVLGDHMYVFGGSTNDDSSIVGPSGPRRIYYQDVWRSADGAEWELVTDAAPWEPRAGAAVVVRDETLFLLGGEDGFTCEPLPDCEAPYFNDVWSTVDGESWELVTEAAGWSPRPGHACELVGNQIVCFGGFGLITNPIDVWASVDGAEWTQLAGAPWNATTSEEIKYDFDALTIRDADGNDLILTAGGDRETFDFEDPENYLRIDDDVWTFAP